MGNLHGVGGAPPASRWQRLSAPALTSLALSLLFLGVYGGTNWFTSLRSDVGTWHFEWERAIPFVPIMIIPYMSIDLFFVAAPFLCRHQAERDTLARRIAFVIVVGGMCFLLFPLRLAFEKPAVEGWLGAVFNTFCEMDKPFNLLPSLHIALQTILMIHYALHTGGLLRAVVYVWFLLIGASTVLTFQHHVVDVAGGLVLGVAAMYLFRETVTTTSATRNLRIALYYGIASILLVGLAVLLWPWGALLLWPTASLMIATAGYCGLGARIFRKSEGVLPWSTRILLAPLLVGQYLSLVYYRRQCRAWDEAAPGVLIGRLLTDAEAEDAVRAGVTAVLDLTGEFSEAKPFRGTTYLNLPILDLTAPTMEDLRRAIAFITQESSRGTVYVHCKIGYSRSAAVVGAYLLATGRAASADEAVERLRKARPSIVVRAEAMESLQVFEQEEKRMRERDALALNAG